MPLTWVALVTWRKMTAQSSHSVSIMALASTTVHATRVTKTWSGLRRVATALIFPSVPAIHARTMVLVSRGHAQRRLASLTMHATVHLVGVVTIARRITTSAHRFHACTVLNAPSQGRLEPMFPGEHFPARVPRDTLMEAVLMAILLSTTHCALLMKTRDATLMSTNVIAIRARTGQRVWIRGTPHWLTSWSMTHSLACAQLDTQMVLAFTNQLRSTFLYARSPPMVPAMWT